MKCSAAASSFPASRAAEARATALRMPSASFGGGLLHVHQREQRRLVQRERAHAPGIREGGDQRHRAAVRMAYQREGRAGCLQHRLDERYLVAQADHAIGRPRRAPAGVVRVGGDDPKARGERLHQPAPLPRGAGVGVDADHARAGARLAIVRLWPIHASSVPGDHDLEVLAGHDHGCISRPVELADQREQVLLQGQLRRGFERGEGL